MNMSSFALGAGTALAHMFYEVNAVDANNARSTSEVRARALGGCGGLERAHNVNAKYLSLIEKIVINR